MRGKGEKGRKTSLRSEVMGTSNLIPYLLGFPVWMAGHWLPKGPMPYVLTTWTSFRPVGQHWGGDVM
jgi:hypothetical protein